MRVNLWFNPYVSPTAPLYRKLLPFAGTHLVWNGIVPDYTLPEPRKIFAEHLAREVLNVNPRAVGGFKIDEVDGYDRYLWPDTARFPSGRDGEQTAADLRAARAARRLRPLPPREPPHARAGARHQRGRVGAARSSSTTTTTPSTSTSPPSRTAASRACSGRPRCAAARARTCCGARRPSSSRRSRSSTAGPPKTSSGRTRKSKTTSATRSSSACVCCLTSTRPSRSTTTKARRSCGPCSSCPASRPPTQAETGRLDATANPYAIGRVNEVKDQYMLGDALLVAPDRARHEVAQGRPARGPLVRLLHGRAGRRKSDHRSHAAALANPALRQGRRARPARRRAPVDARARRGRAHRDTTLRPAARHARALRRRRRDLQLRAAATTPGRV